MSLRGAMALARGAMALAPGATLGRSRSTHTYIIFSRDSSAPPLPLAPLTLNFTSRACCCMALAAPRSAPPLVGPANDSLSSCGGRPGGGLFDEATQVALEGSLHAPFPAHQADHPATPAHQADHPATPLGLRRLPPLGLLLPLSLPAVGCCGRACRHQGPECELFPKEESAVAEWAWVRVVRTALLGRRPGREGGQ